MSKRPTHAKGGQANPPKGPQAKGPPAHAAVHSLKDLVGGKNPYPGPTPTPEGDLDVVLPTGSRSISVTLKVKS